MIVVLSVIVFALFRHCADSYVTVRTLPDACRLAYLLFAVPSMISH
jgi:hypothetical protein